MPDHPEDRPSSFLLPLSPDAAKLGGTASEPEGLTKLLTSLAEDGATVTFEAQLAAFAGPGSEAHSTLLRRLRDEAGAEPDEGLASLAAAGGRLSAIFQQAAQRYLIVDLDLAGLLVLLSDPAVEAVAPRWPIRPLRRDAEARS